jgi:hypothetical protein
MKKLFIVFMTLIPLTLYADIGKDIALQGDKVWDNLLFLYKREASLIEIGDAPDFSQDKRYLKKIVHVPLIDFSNVIKDRAEKEYYYFSETNTSPLLIFPHNPSIQPQLDILKIAFGNMENSFEVLGRISNVFTVDDAEDILGTDGVWADRDVAIVEICAFRIKNKVCVLVDPERVVPVAEELVATLQETRIMNWTVNIPENVTAVPADLEPEKVAQWFLFFGSIRKNSQIWNQLCSIDRNIVSNAGLLRPLGQSWWRTISLMEHKYFFVGNDASSNNATSQTFLYGVRENDKTIATEKRLTVTREQSGQWRVSSFELLRP